MKRPMKTQSCKSKGRRLQQKVASSILESFSHLGDGDVVSTSMGAPGEDVRLSPLARSSIPLSIECKCQEKISIWACIEQAQTNAPSGATPCLVFSRNRSQTYAVVPWDVLLSLYARLDTTTGNGSIPPRLADLLAQISQFATSPPAEELGEQGTESA